MLGVEVKRGANAALRDLAIEHNVLALPAGRTVLRLLPPLTLTHDDADAIVEAVAAVMGEEPP
jgi:acetylornithine/LysW-gamma-L-lysine aminotransferase